MSDLGQVCGDLRVGLKKFHDSIDNHKTLETTFDDLDLQPRGQACSLMAL